MSPDEKRAMIKRDHPELNITQQCKLVRLSRSAFYYAPAGIDAETLSMMKDIDRIFTKYRSRLVWPLWRGLSVVCYAACAA